MPHYISTKHAAERVLSLELVVEIINGMTKFLLHIQTPLLNVVLIQNKAFSKQG